MSDIFGYENLPADLTDEEENEIVDIYYYVATIEDYVRRTIRRDIEWSVSFVEWVPGVEIRISFEGYSHSICYALESIDNYPPGRFINEIKYLALEVLKKYYIVGLPGIEDTTKASD